MTNTLSVSDVTKNVQLNLTSDVQFSYGLNSPYPEEGQAPVPAASLNVGGDAMDNVYRLDNVARIEQHRQGTNFRERVFGGRFATTSDAPIGQMSVAHASNELNKDIRTWPIIRPRTPDTSNGRRVIAGALRHWYSECNLTEFGVRGDFLFNTSNFTPTIAYYDHPNMRFRGENYIGNSTVSQTNIWTRTEPYSADPGASFDIGETVSFILKYNENFGVPADGEVQAQSKAWLCAFELSAGKAFPDALNDNDNNSNMWLNIQYNPSNRTLSITERNSSGSVSNVRTIEDKVPGYIETPKFIEINITRETATNVHYYVTFHHTNGTTVFDFVSTLGLYPQQLALVRVEATAIQADYSTTNLSQEGIQGVYVVKGKAQIVEEDSWEIQLPWFDKPKWKEICVPAITGNAWALIHEFCTVYGLTFNPIHNTFILNEDLGMNNPWPTGQGSSVIVQASTREMAETVELYNYNYSVAKNDNYVSVWKADRVFSVALGEKIEEIITLPEGTSVLDISQPICRRVQTVINWWNLPDDANVNSVYSVFDDDNVEVDPNSWNDSGGYVSIEHTDNVNELKVIIQAPNNELISKSNTFHLSIAGSDIPSLLIAAIGIRANKEKFVIKTGAGKSRNLKTVGTEYDNPFVCNTRLAFDLGAKLATLHGTTMTRASGTFPPLKAHDFPGLPVLKRGSYYRPVSIVDTPTSLNVSESIRFNPVEWVQSNYTNISCGDFNTKWANSICREVNISPLGKDHF